jgi:hypothetical protein
MYFLAHSGLHHTLAQALGGDHSMDQHNNQLKVGGIKG